MAQSASIGKGSSSGPKGFTLVEIMIVVVIIGVLASIAIPAFQRIREASRASAFSNDLRMFRDAIEIYAMENGSYPPDSGPGTADSDLLTYLPVGFMDRETPIGGVWDVDMNGAAGVTAAVGAAQLDDPDENLLIRIDEQIDDGDLGSGKLQQLVANRIYWVIEE